MRIAASISVIAGSGAASLRDDSVGALATLSDPCDISIADSGAYALVSDSGNNCVRQVTLSNVFEVATIPSYSFTSAARKV